MSDSESDGMLSGDEGATNSGDQNEHPGKKRANHNELERKRRQVQKQKLLELREVVPAVRLEKPSAIQILLEAKKYIDQLTSRSEHLETELSSVRQKAGIVAPPPPPPPIPAPRAVKLGRPTKASKAEENAEFEACRKENSELRARLQELKRRLNEDGGTLTVDYPLTPQIHTSPSPALGPSSPLHFPLRSQSPLADPSLLNNLTTTTTASSSSSYSHFVPSANSAFTTFTNHVHFGPSPENEPDSPRNSPLNSASNSPSPRSPSHSRSASPASFPHFTPPAPKEEPEASQAENNFSISYKKRKSRADNDFEMAKKEYYQRRNSTVEAMRDHQQRINEVGLLHNFAVQARRASLPSAFMEGFPPPEDHP